LSNSKQLVGGFQGFDGVRGEAFHKRAQLRVLAYSQLAGTSFVGVEEVPHLLVVQLHKGHLHPKLNAIALTMA
jgi:hypothetical protein